MSHEQPSPRYRYVEPTRGKPLPTDKLVRAIKHRATDSRGRLCCERDGRPLMREQKYHLSHRRHIWGAKFYNTENNIDLFCVQHHYGFHLDAIDDPQTIGLTLERNYGALWLIWLSLTEHERNELDAQGLFVGDLIPKPLEETAYQRWLAEQPAPVFDPSGFEFLAGRGERGSLAEAVPGVSLADRGIPIPGLPQQVLPDSEGFIFDATQFYVALTPSGLSVAELSGGD